MPGFESHKPLDMHSVIIDGKVADPTAMLTLEMSVWFEPDIVTGLNAIQTQAIDQVMAAEYMQGIVDGCTRERGDLWGKDGENLIGGGMRVGVPVEIFHDL